jgi:hypothetical protein
MALIALVVSALLSALVGTAAQSKNFTGAPETFHARARVSTEAARGDVYLDIRVQKYTPDKDRDVVLKALETGGTVGFVEAVRKAPIAGQIDIGKQTFTIRWAREVTDEKGRTITLVTERPVYFVGAGLPDAKPRTGYDVAVVQLKMDPAGVGEGVMAAAAKVKPGEPTGVQVDDYSSEPIKLLSVTRKIQ